MPPAERLELARAAYVRAIAHAREESTSATWARLLAAAKNLVGAKRDVERTRRRPCAPARGDRGSASGARPSPVTSRGALAGAREPEPSRLDVREPRRGSSAHRWLGRWPELVAEWERARTLMEHSRRLVEESHALCTAVARLSTDRLFP